jgi:hypothetical protein
MATVDTKMKTSVAGIRRVALAAALLAGATLISCGPGTRTPDASGPNLPSGVARPATATSTAAALAPLAVPIEVTRLVSEPAVASSTPVSDTSATTSDGFALLVLHSNDVRGYSLPCG